MTINRFIVRSIVSFVRAIVLDNLLTKELLHRKLDKNSNFIDFYLEHNKYFYITRAISLISISLRIKQGILNDFSVFGLKQNKLNEILEKYNNQFQK